MKYSEVKHALNQNEISFSEKVPLTLLGNSFIVFPYQKNVYNLDILFQKNIKQTPHHHVKSREFASRHTVHFPLPFYELEGFDPEKSEIYFQLPRNARKLDSEIGYSEAKLITTNPKLFLSIAHWLAPYDVVVREEPNSIDIQKKDETISIPKAETVPLTLDRLVKLLSQNAEAKA